MASLKSKTRQEFMRKQGQAFNEKAFNRLWKTTTQHVRRIGQNVVNPSTEAYYHLTGKGESILDYTYSIGGARGQKQTIQEHFRVKLTTDRTANFMIKNGNKVVDGKRLNTWLKDFKNGKISKDEFYSKIDLFKVTNKKYLSTGSK